jgi:hypothetical protein
MGRERKPDGQDLTRREGDADAPQQPPGEPHAGRTEDAGHQVRRDRGGTIAQQVEERDDREQRHGRDGWKGRVLRA